MKIIFSLVLALIDLSLGEITSKEVRCAVCRTVVAEMEKEISKVNPNKKIQIGGYRIDEDGRLQEKLIPYVRSAVHLTELMEEFCKNMENYVRAKHKETGEVIIMKLLSEDGGMNPDIGNVDIIQDSDLNKSLEFHCEGIMEEFEPAFYEALRKPSDDQVNKICMKETKLCETTEDLNIPLQKEEL